MNLARLVAIGMLLSLPLAACDGNPPGKGPVTNGPDRDASVPDVDVEAGDVPTPATAPAYRTAAPRPESLASWGDSLRRLAPRDRRFLESTNARYLGMLESATPEEAARLRDLGFPMPEDWLESRALSDSELKVLADGGSHKAQMFYADRQLSRLLGAGDASGGTSGAGSAASQASAYSSVSLRYSKSPFAAYMFGVVNQASSGHPEAMAAGILAAGRLGDQARAKVLARRFALEHPALDLGLLASYDQMISRMIEWQPR